MDITYSRAITLSERSEATTIIKKQYTESGYTLDETDVDKKMQYFLEQETSQVFIARYEGHPLATVSLIEDSPLGLPLDELYKEEIDTLRKRGLRLAEVSQLAIDTPEIVQLFSEKIAKKNILLLPLFQIILQSAIHQKIDALCIAINPKHDFFYTTLGFETIGDLKYYASFNNAPAFAKVLMLDTLKTKKEKTTFLSRMISTTTPLDPLFLNGEKTSLTLPLDIPLQ